MSFYQKVTHYGLKFIARDKLFKYGFNWSPMYRRSTGKVIEVSKDLLKIRIKIPISYKNKNYVGSIFGGSMFSAVDPFPMTQLMNLLGNDYVVWDKSASIVFKIPARETLYADFEYSLSELEEIKKRVAEENEIDFVKKSPLTNKDRSKTFCEVDKVIYVANKDFYKQKVARRKLKS